MDGTFSVLISGVGGQGIVLMSRVLGAACVAEGIPVVTGEQHGLSQRSGSVSIHFRMGQGIVSPLIPAGTGDAIVGLEALESLRYLEYLRPGGLVLTSTLVQRPITRSAEIVKDATVRYTSTDDVIGALRTIAGLVVPVDARKLAGDAGNPQAENMVMLGALSAAGSFPVTVEAMEKAVSEIIPGAAMSNLAAFRAGRSLGLDLLKSEAGRKS